MTERSAYFLHLLCILSCYVQSHKLPKIVHCNWVQNGTHKTKRKKTVSTRQTERKIDVTIGRQKTRKVQKPTNRISTRLDSTFYLSLKTFIARFHQPLNASALVGLSGLTKKRSEQTHTKKAFIQVRVHFIQFFSFLFVYIPMLDKICVHNAKRHTYTTRRVTTNYSTFIPTVFFRFARNGFEKTNFFFSARI